MELETMHCEPRRYPQHWWLAALLGAAVTHGCEEGTAAGSDVSTDVSNDVSADAGPDATSDAADVVTVPGCDAVVQPSGNDYETIQGALIDAATGDTVCLTAGSYTVSEALSLSGRGITLRGPADGEAVLDFSAQNAGPSSLLITGSDATIEKLTFRNSPGDTVVAEGADNVVFRDLDIRWDGEPDGGNGAYAIFPVGCTNVLVEGCTVHGASDAGIYIGQCTNVVVRDNEVFGNVAGIEIENSIDAEVHSNHVWDNSAGILVFNLPNLPLKNGHRTRVYDNQVEANNRANFAAEGNIVALVPHGIGIMTVAFDEVEIDHNTLTGNGTSGIVVVSFLIVQVLGYQGAADPEHDKYPETVFIHDNVYSDNGQAPHAATAAMMGVETLEDIVWDGVIDAAKPNPEHALDLCIQEAEGVTFRDLNLMQGLQNPSTDIGLHDCTHQALPPIQLPSQ